MTPARRSGRQSDLDAARALAQQANAQGITWIASSGNCRRRRMRDPVPRCSRHQRPLGNDSGRIPRGNGGRRHLARGQARRLDARWCYRGERAILYRGKGMEFDPAWPGTGGVWRRRQFVYSDAGMAEGAGSSQDRCAVGSRYRFRGGVGSRSVPDHCKRRTLGLGRNSSTPFFAGRGRNSEPVFGRVPERRPLPGLATSTRDSTNSPARRRTCSTTSPKATTSCPANHQLLTACSSVTATARSLDTTGHRPRLTRRGEIRAQLVSRFGRRHDLYLSEPRREVPRPSTPPPRPPSPPPSRQRPAVSHPSDALRSAPGPGRSGDAILSDSGGSATATLTVDAAQLSAGTNTITAQYAGASGVFAIQRDQRDVTRDRRRCR